MQALQDTSINRIILPSNYTVASEPQAPSSSPVRLERNVTIEGKPGQVPPVTLDLAFRRSMAVLCDSCVVMLRNLTLRNARRGSGAALDFFVGDDTPADAAVLLEGVYRHRVACTPGSDAAEVLNNTPRSAHLPRSATGKQMFTVKTVEFQGVTYPDALHLIDFSQDLPLTHQEGRGHSAVSHFGGYALGSRDVLYLCEHVVTEACLADKSPDACVNELIDNVLSAQKAGHTHRGPSGALLAAIIVPLVVVGALLTAVALWLLKRRQRQQQLQHGSDTSGKPTLPPLVPSPMSGLYSDGDGPLVPPGACSTGRGLDSASDVHSTHSKSHGGRRSLEVAMQPRGRQEGWQLVSTDTAPFVQPPVGPEAEVEFGAFLGAGSYGRVYRARWAGYDVACKVIQHDRSTLTAVEAEASLMLTLDHPNVVRAYHYSTFTYTESAQGDRAARGSRTWSHNGQPGGRHQSSNGSHSSKDSLHGQHRHGPVVDSAQQLDANSDSCSGSGSGARVLLQRRLAAQQQQQHRQQQQPPQQQGCVDEKLARQESHDVLVTNLSLDAEGAQQAAAVAESLAGLSAESGQGSGGADTVKAGGLMDSNPSADEHGLFGTLDGRATVKHKAETWLVQEFCDMGTLGGIASTWESSDECDEQMLERLQLLHDTARGLEALHTNHVVHGDINARNVLVSSSSSSPTGMTAKVADLGLARCLSQHATHRTTNSCGTMSHMAPELLRYGRLSPAVDVYAFGIMMWELYHQGQAAFDKLHYGQFFETVVLRKVRPCVPAGMPPDYELLMRQCWAADPADRPSASVLCQALQVMEADRTRRVQAAAGSSSPQGVPAAAGPGASAPAALPPVGVDVVPVLQALLPRRGPSPAGPPTPQPGAVPAAAGPGRAAARPPVGPGPGSRLVSPDNSSTALSAGSLSALFPDCSADAAPEATVLVIGDPADSAAAPAASTSRLAAMDPLRRVRAGLSGSGRSVATGAAAAQADLEGQVLDKDPSVHSNRLWFV